MSLTVVIAILAVIATLAAALLQPLASKWLTPKQKLRVEVTASQFVIPRAISREMSQYHFQLRVKDTKLQPEFGEFLRDAERYQSFFDLAIINTGKTVSRNVVLACSPYGKYVIIKSRNKSEYHSDQPEYFLGDLQPSEKIRCQIWSATPLPTYEFSAIEMFSIRDDHDSSKQIVLRRFFDRTSHYLFERAFIETLFSMLKWTLIPPLLFLSLGYLAISIFRHWPF